MKKRKMTLGSLGALLLLSIIASQVGAQSFVLRKVADLNTPIPGGSGNFLGFGRGGYYYPVISGNNVAFIGEYDFGVYGIYLFNGTTIIRVADSNTPIPGASGNFTGFAGCVISGGNVAFYGWDGQLGIYLFNGSTLVKVADGFELQQIPPVISGSNVAFWIPGQGIYLFNGTTLRIIAYGGTPIPGGLGYFTDFWDPVISGNNVAFQAEGESEQQGIYLYNGTTLSKVADLNTPIPEGSGNFTSFWGPMISGNNIAFHAWGQSGQEGIYLYDGITLSKVADLNTPIPEGSGNFGFLGLRAISGRNVVIWDLFWGGIYFYNGTNLSKVVDINTPIPGGAGNFTYVDYPGIDGSNVVFYGEGSRPGIYLFNGTTISKVADLYTQIPGGSGNFGQLYPPLISGNNVTFVGGGSDQLGIYLASPRQEPPPAISKMRFLTETGDTITTADKTMSHYFMSGEDGTLNIIIREPLGFVRTYPDIGIHSIPGGNCTLQGDGSVTANAGQTFSFRVGCSTPGATLSALYLPLNSGGSPATFDPLSGVFQWSTSAGDIGQYLAEFQSEVGGVTLNTVVLIAIVP